MPDLIQALRDFVATSNSGKYKTEDELLSKFPELKGYDVNALRDFVATSNSGKYKTEDELLSKFPEFSGAPVDTQPVKKKRRSVYNPSVATATRTTRARAKARANTPVFGIQAFGFFFGISKSS